MGAYAAYLDGKPIQSTRTFEGNAVDAGASGHGHGEEDAGFVSRGRVRLADLLVLADLLGEDAPLFAG